MPQEDRRIALDDAAANHGIVEEMNFRAGPSPDGIFYRADVRLPEFSKACYYAPFQKYAINPSLDLWPEGYNQCHPLPLTDLRYAKRGGIFLILELEDGGYMALLPIVTGTSMAWFRGGEDGLILEAGHWGTVGWNGRLPLLAWARDANLYKACEEAWKLALVHLDGARPRGEKTYPEPFRYLGWCSWEEFKWDIRDDLLREVIEDIETSSVPIRWVLIDDGHIDEDSPRPAAAAQDGEVPAQENERRLRSFEINRQRFPEGWEPVVAAARKTTKLKWLGLWLNFNGYWGGISARNDLGVLGKDLVELSPGVLQPRPAEQSASRFYSAFIEKQKSAGFDFVKVDNQAKNITFYRGRVPNAVEAVMHNHHGLEAAVGKDMEAMINCMAHNNLCAFSPRHSQITRCSEDYKKGDLWRAKHHLNNSFANMLWLGQTVWGDHDMFHSSDEVAGGVMARSKAISGGPIYLSDHPANLRAEAIRPLCFEDGLLLQPLAPAAPLPESAFINTYEDDRAYRVIAPLPHACAAVAAYNLTHPEKPVTGRLEAADYRHAGGMLQDGRDEWPLPPEGLVAYDAKRRRIHHLGRGPLDFRIDSFGDEFFILSPVTAGWAVIGRADKYLSPAGVASAEISASELKVTLRESGPFLFWMASGRPAAEGNTPPQDLGGGLWLLDLEVAPRSATLVIRRVE